MVDQVLTVRSVLFMPADKPAMIAKIPAIAPDVAVVDLEDAVPAEGKNRARQALPGVLRGLDVGPTRLCVRVNPPDSPWFLDDLALLRELAPGGTGVVLPKYEHPDQLRRVRAVVGDVPVVVGIESVLGVADARPLLGEAVDAVYFGAEDYIADIGGRRTAAGLEVLYARSATVAAARLNGVAAVDQAVMAVKDDDAYRRDADVGRSLGYAGKLCLHPAQVVLAHEVFTPAPAEVRHAREVLAAGRNGAAALDGQMVDEVHLKMARQTLARAGETAP